MSRPSIAIACLETLRSKIVFTYRSIALTLSRGVWSRFTTCACKVFANATLLHLFCVRLRLPTSLCWAANMDCVRRTQVRCIWRGRLRGSKWCCRNETARQHKPTDLRSRSTLLCRAATAHRRQRVVSKQQINAWLIVWKASHATYTVARPDYSRDHCGKQMGDFSRKANAENSEVGSKS